MEFCYFFESLPLFGFLGWISPFRNYADRIEQSAMNVCAIFGRNTKEFWEKSYKSGYWKFLDDREQRPRHYAVAGILKDYFPKGVSVLEIGCSYAPILPLLPTDGIRYTGLDISSEVIEICKKKHERNVNFFCGQFEEMKFQEKFGAIVASEVLYYYPILKIPSVVDKIFSHLDPDGILVVTMNKNPKAWIIWLLLGLRAKTVGSIVAMNSTGSKWKIRIFQAKSN